MNSQFIYFRTLAPKTPWIQVGLKIVQRSVIVVYNCQTKILAAQPFEEGSMGEGCGPVGPATLALVDDPCIVFDFIAHEVKLQRLLDCDIMDEEELSEEIAQVSELAN